MKHSGFDLWLASELCKNFSIRFFWEVIFRYLIAKDRLFNGIHDEPYIMLNTIDIGFINGGETGGFVTYLSFGIFVL